MPRAALRPDKLIVYHRTPDARERWSRRLLARLARCPAQGVPFTQQVGDTPLVSFAEDPKPQGGDTNPESWRSWLVACLGTALYVARAAGANPDVAWASALHAVSLEGVDPSLWRRRPGSAQAGFAS